MLASVPTRSFRLALPLGDWTPKQIRALRKRLGYSQADMAAALGYSRLQSISELETGARPAKGPVAVLLDYLDKHGDLTADQRRKGEA